MTKPITEMTTGEFAALTPETLAELKERIGRAEAMAGKVAAADSGEEVEEPVDLTSLASPEVLSMETFRPLHTFMAEQVSAAMAEGTLPPEYALPDPEVFEAQLKALLPVYEKYQDNFWKPNVGFVPRGLGLEEFGRVLEGFALDEDGMRHSEAAMVVNEVDNPREVTFTNDPEDRKPVRDGVYWELVVSASADEVVLPKLAPNGEGENAQAQLKKLRETGVYNPAASDEALIEAASPTALTHLALQWQRLLTERRPLCRSGSLMEGVVLKERIVDNRRVPMSGTTAKALAGEWPKRNLYAGISAVPMSPSDYMRWGVNPAVRARDIVEQPAEWRPEEAPEQSTVDPTSVLTLSDLPTPRIPSPPARRLHTEALQGATTPAWPTYTRQ